MRWVVVVALGTLALAACSGGDVAAFDASARPESNEFTVQLDTCRDDWTIDVRETDATVTLRASVPLVWGSSGGDCVTTATVTLDAPLGDRAIVDAVDHATIAPTP